MSNKPTSLILFKRRAPDNSKTEHLISVIDSKIARRTELNARIIAHNKRVREVKVKADLKPEPEPETETEPEPEPEKETKVKSTRIINRTAINNNVNMF